MFVRKHSRITMPSYELSEGALNENNCIICLGNLDSLVSDRSYVKVTLLGLNTINSFSVQLGDLGLATYLSTKPVDVYVHVECRKKYTNGRRLEQEQKLKVILAVEDCVKPPKSLRSVTNSFSWKMHCLFCSETAHFDSRHPDRSSNISVVRTLTIS